MNKLKAGDTVMITRVGSQTITAAWSGEFGLTAKVALIDEPGGVHDVCGVPVLLCRETPPDNCDWELSDSFGFYYQWVPKDVLEVVGREDE